jgi:predicted permease
MGMPAELWRRLKLFFWRGQFDRDLREEIQHHVAMKTETLLSRQDGMSPEEARDAAHREFGNILLLRERSRDTWGFRWLEALLQDLCYGLRMLRRSPGFTAVAVLTLALGIGANTAIFTLVDAVMLRALPVKNPSRLVLFRWNARSFPQGRYASSNDCEESRISGCTLPLPVINQIRAQASAFSGLAAFCHVLLQMTGNGPATSVSGDAVSGDYFSALGVGTVLGRPLGPTDDNPSASSAAVLSYAYWRSQFGGSPSAVGRTVYLNKIPFTIVGVADPSFTNLSPGMPLTLWLPVATLSKVGRSWGMQFDELSTWTFVALARLKPAVSLSQAQAAANLIFRDEMLHGGTPEMKQSDDPRLVLQPAEEGLTGERTYYAGELYLMMFGVGMILLIACANVAGLLVARGAKRQKEIAVRLALGASGGRIVRQLVTESTLLSVVGGVLGGLLSFWGLHLILPMFALFGSDKFPFVLAPDWRVLVFVVSLSILSGVFFGLAPAIQSRRLNLTGSLKECISTLPGGVRRRRWLHLGNGLVVAQVALSAVVLAGAGLLVRTLEEIRSINPGFDPHNVLLFEINPGQQGYGPARTLDFYRQLWEQFAALPGVTAVSYSATPLLSGYQTGTTVKIEGRPDESDVSVDTMNIGPDFLRTMHIPLLAGRGFNAQDLEAKTGVPEPLLVNEAFVRQYLGSGNPLGQRLSAGLIVGVVGDIKYTDLLRAVHPTIYFPFVLTSAEFELRTAHSPAALVPAVKQIVKRLDSNMPVENIRTQEQQIDQILWQQRMLAKLSSFFAVLALALACIGLYGLLAYEVARRTREIGIRVALGAQSRDVLRLIIGEGAALTITGAAAGTCMALGVTRYLASWLYSVSAMDPITFAGVPISLILVALAACYIPARRAMKVDPMVALRYE